MVLAGALGSAPATLAAAESPRVLLVGDSTMATRTGYGDALCGLFKWQVECVNLARGGRSTRSFRADGSWERVVAALAIRTRPTFVFIQFGHNDQPGKAERSTDLAREFPANLERYVHEVRDAGAEPVLVTPLARRGMDTLAPWALAVRAVAAREGVPILDLHAASLAALSSMAAHATHALGPDATHVNPKGAALFARIVAREISTALPSLAGELVVGAVEPPGPIARPLMTEQQATAYAYRKVLGDWDPLAESRPDKSAAPDFVVEAGTSIQAAVNAAIARGGRERVRILVRPGIYRELLFVPDAPMPITIYGEGPDAAAVRITSRPSGSIRATVALVRNRGFQARNLTIENAHNKERGDIAEQTQAVALTLEDADRAHLENVRLLGFQDTFFLAATTPERPPRVFIHRSYVEGDMDFVFGEATAYFLETEIRTLGDRAVSYTLAPSTHRASRFGFVFASCRFTHDGTPNARAGAFKLARQWYRNDDAVGKVAILHSSIGAHIDPVRPWADWSIGTPRHRPVQYEFLAEFDNTSATE